MKIFLIFCLAILASCSSAFKKSDTFVEDSEFLKQGHKIEDYEEEVVEEPKDEKPKTEVGKEKKPHPKKEIVKDIKKKVEDTVVKGKKAEKPSGFPFKVGEEVTLSATFFGVEAGKILIGVDKFKKFAGKKQYHFYAFGKTSSVFSMFYKVKNKIETLWDPELKKPSSLAFDVVETKQKYKIRVYFDWLKKQGEYLEEGWAKKKGDYRVQKKWTLEEKAQDIVSAAFYMRTFPLKVGKEYKLTVMEEDKIIDVHFKVDRKEVLKTRVGKFDTLVLKPRFSTKGKFKQVGDISVWLTDDSYRQVVRIESKIKIGTVVAKLHSLKRP
ncbi:MAG: DUF3108 domain-containing protein [Bdellovibrionales bacterium]